MAAELCSSLRGLRTVLKSVCEDMATKKWVQETCDDNKYTSWDLSRALRVLRGMCCCGEKFLLQGLPILESEVSFFEQLRAAINLKRDEIHTIRWRLEVEEVCSSIVNGVETLKPLFEKVIDNFLQGEKVFKIRHITGTGLRKFIRFVRYDAKGIHNETSLKLLQLHKLEFLESFIILAHSRGVGLEELQDLCVHTEMVVFTAAYFSYMLWKNGISDLTTIASQYNLMLKAQLNVREGYIRVLKALGSSSSLDESPTKDYAAVRAFVDHLSQNHWDLLESKSSFTVSHVKILIEKLQFLKNFLFYKRNEDWALDEEMTNLIFDVVSEAGILSYSLSWDDMKEVPTRETKLGILNWMEKIQLLIEDIMKNYPETSRYKFPRTNELLFMDGLVEDLKELIRCNPDSIAFAQGQVDVVLEDLVFLRDFLRDTVKQCNEHKELKALWLCVVEVAYRSEFVINSFVVGDHSPDCSPTSFNAIKEEIKKIRAEIEEIHKGKKFQIEPLNTPKISNRLPSRSSNPTLDEVVVGFKDEAQTIIDQLEANYDELDIVSIVGMPGQGKTTLAKKVYHDIRSRFLVCAWCCVSQGYQKRKLLLDILSYSLDELPSRVDEKSDEDLENDLRQSLMGRKYLIILDDIWDIEAWIGLKPSFPDDRNGSRILITSRLHIEELQAKPHYIRQLNDDDSWELLQRKLFQGKGCPAELEDLVKQIAKSCKGLPFAVVTIAGILVTLEPDSWADFANGLSTDLVSGKEEFTELLELSYMHLPDYLKPCLLYFGSFLQDQEILVSRLIWLWKAEGFVRKTTDEESLEYAAEDCLIELINRSLVMIVKQTSRGGIKACSVHDLVHQFCMKRAKEENFLQLLNLKEEILPLFEPRRLCAYSWRDDVRCFRHLSSLKFFSRSCFIEVSSIMCSSKFLNVLDLRGITCSLFPAEVEKLVLLRFLAVAGYFNDVPSTIVKLWNLETFLLKGLRGEISLPYALLNMTKLRHVHVNSRVVFSKPEQNLEKCCESCNLESFSTLLLSSGQQDMVKIIKKIKKLRKLKCTFFGSRDVNYQFPALNILSELESLNVRSTGKVPYPLEFSFPVNLKKLTLSNFALPWASISKFAQLPSLVVLKLVNRACEGETWDMEAEVFNNLQFLKFESLDIVYWNACSYNFPRLRQLVLHKCKKLLRIPSDIREFDSLKVVEVKHCQDSVATSAQILEKEMGGLKTFIYPPPRKEVDSMK